MSADNETRLSGIMFLHPLVAAFMVLWLGVTGYGALTSKSAPVAAMFLFGLSLTLGSFFFEVSRAKHLLKAAIQGSLGENYER